MRSNFNDFLAKLVSDGTRPSIIILTEIWISENETATYGIDGYTGYYNCSEKSAAGGVAIFVIDKLRSSHIVNYNKNVEACVVNIKLGNRDMRIIGLYRSPSPNISNLNEFMDSDMDNILAFLGKRNDGLWLTDSNIDILSTHGKNGEYVSKLASHGLQNAIDGPTRITQTTTSAIDHVFYRAAKAEMVQAETVDSSGISDHMMIRGSMRYDYAIAQLNRGEIRSKTNRVDFTKGLLDIKPERYLEMQDPQLLIRTLVGNLEELRGRTTKAIAITRHNTPIKPWVSLRIIQMMKLRDKLWQRLRDNPVDESTREKYKVLRNDVRKSLRVAEATYMRGQIEITREPKSAWKFIDEQLRGKRCTQRLPVRLSKEVISCEELNTANEYFIDVGGRVNRQVGYRDTNNDFPRYEVIKPMAEFTVPSADQIEKIIKELKNGKAAGPDGFSASTIKNNLQFFVPIITHLTSLICTTRCYPSYLKQANTVLVHKKGDLDSLSNYRPISVLSVFNKIVEKYLADKIDSHLELNKILVDSQYGFRKKRGTQDAILNLQCAVLDTLDRGNIPVAIFLD